MTTGKIAVIGDRDSILLWRAIGAEAVFAEERPEIEHALARLAKGGAAIIFITEPCAERAKYVIDRYKTAPLPAIIPIPSRDGSTGFAMAELRANVEKAIGADILFNEED